MRESNGDTKTLLYIPIDTVIEQSQYIVLNTEFFKYTPKDIFSRLLLLGEISGPPLLEWVPAKATMAFHQVFCLVHIQLRVPWADRALLQPKKVVRK